MVTFRTATLDDCPTCAKIAYDGGLMTPDYWAIPQGYFEAYVDEDELFIVAESNGEISGFILGQKMKSDNAELILLAVDLNHRRKKIGTKLVTEFRKRCSKQGIHHIDLIAPMNDLSQRFWRSLDVKGGERYTQFCFSPDKTEEQRELPLTLESRWDLLYSRHPEMYDKIFSNPSKRVKSKPIHEDFDLSGKEIVDIGAGTGESTFRYAKYAKHVIGVEPERAMIDKAIRKAKEQGIENVSFVEGSATDIPLPDNSVDMVVGDYFVDHPQHLLIPKFIEESTRVLRNGGMVLVSNSPQGWYGGELDRVIKSDYPGGTHRQSVYDTAGFEYYDVYSVTEYGTPENMVKTYGFIFGMNAINYIRENKVDQLLSLSRRHFKVIRK